MRIEARGVAAGHGGRPVLSGVDLAVGPGELVGLIGPNGSGKTTLLRVLAGLAPPLAGEVLYDGRRVTAVPARARARQVAFLAQGGEVQWGVSVETVVALGRLPHRAPFAGPSAADRAAVERALALVDIAHLAPRPVSTLSGGERARVLLARALAVEAEILLADEPVASLDPRHALATLGLLRAAAGRGTGIVVVLHDLVHAARFCTRLVLVANGRVLADDVPPRVLTDEALSAAYGISVARASHEGEAYVLPWRPIAGATERTRDAAR